MDDTIDPYRPDASADERADHVVGVLLADEDPVRRYRTIQALQDGRLRDVAAISLRQLRDAHGSTEAAGAAIGISRQAVNELLAKAGAPGAREDKAARNLPAYQYGQYLAAVRAIADAIPTEAAREKAILRWYDLEAKASQSVSMLPTLAETAQRWLKAVRAGGHPRRADHHAATLDERGANIADWVAGRTDPHLSVQEQADMYIGYHTARVQRRQEYEQRNAD